MKYKLVASDFDDTLFPPSEVIDKYTTDTIHRYIAAGGRFVICTGRMYASIVQQAKKLGLKGYIISYQGALTKDIESGKIFDCTALDADLAREYVGYMRGKSNVIQVYVGDKLCVEHKNPFSEKYAEFCNVTLHSVGDMDAFLKNTDEPIFKVFCMVDEDKCDAIREKTKADYGDRLLINSSKKWNVEMVDIKTSKGSALEKLCAFYGIGRNDVMAFGDNLNDLELVEYAGFGVAVGNAVDELKKAADYIAEDCADDGVAKTIEKFCFQGE